MFFLGAVYIFLYNKIMNVVKNILSATLHCHKTLSFPRVEFREFLCKEFYYPMYEYIQQILLPSSSPYILLKCSTPLNFSHTCRAMFRAYLFSMKNVLISRLFVQTFSIVFSIFVSSGSINIFLVYK